MCDAAKTVGKLKPSPSSQCGAILVNHAPIARRVVLFDNENGVSAIRFLPMLKVLDGGTWTVSIPKRIGRGVP